MLKKKYSDVNYKLSFDKFGAVKTEIDFDAITQSIITILGTVTGERVMNPEFGSRLRDLLYDPMDAFTARNIEEEVRASIRRWESRARVIRVEVEPDLSTQVYSIRIWYTATETDRENNSLEIKARFLG